MVVGQCVGQIAGLERKACKLNSQDFSQSLSKTKHLLLKWVARRECLAMEFYMEKAAILMGRKDGVGTDTID